MRANWLKLLSFFPPFYIIVDSISVLLVVQKKLFDGISHHFHCFLIFYALKDLRVKKDI